MKRYILFVVIALSASFLLSCEKDAEKEYIIASKTRIFCAEAPYMVFLIRTPSERTWREYDDPIVAVKGLDYEDGYEYRVKGQLKHHKANRNLMDDFSSNTLVVSKVISSERKDSENLPGGRYWDPAWPSWYSPCSGLSVEEYREMLLAAGLLDD